MNTLSENELHLIINKVKTLGNELLIQWDNISEINLKDDQSYITSSDLYADKELRKILPQIRELPVYSEEDDTEKIDDDCWLVDPIDGTGAFVAGIPTWAITITLILNRSPEFGLICFPVTKKIIHSQMPEEAFRMIGYKEKYNKEDFICVPSDVHSRYKIDFPGKVRSLGSASSQIYYSVTGKSCFSIIGPPALWDFSAGIPIVKKASGKIVYLSRAPIDFSALMDRMDNIESPVLICHEDAVGKVIGMVTVLT